MKTIFIRSGGRLDIGMLFNMVEKEILLELTG